MKQLLFVFLILTMVSINILPQGKIMSNEEANASFGAVLISKEIPTSTLQSLLNVSNKVIMFGIIKNDVYVLDNMRNVLMPAGLSVSSSDVFSMYSKVIVQQLLEAGSSPVTYIEKRENVLTVTNGSSTLEFAWLCPPFCLED